MQHKQIAPSFIIERWGVLMCKRQDAALETQQKIIEVMRALLQEKNANEINIEEITQCAGVAKGSLYTHFRRM